MKRCVKLENILIKTVKVNMINRIILMGKIASDIKKFDGNIFDLSVERTYKGKTEIFVIECHIQDEYMINFALSSLKEKDFVHVMGRLKNHNEIDMNTGKKIYKMIIIVEDLQKV